MKRQSAIIALAATLVAGAAGFGAYRLGVNRGTEAAATTAAAAAPAGKKVLYWHDPMVPGQRFDQPGKSPFMDMPLVPVYADDGGDDGVATGSVRIDPRVRQNLGIRTAEVTRASLAPALQAVGTIAFDERAVALVQARAGGYVERLHARAPMDAVRRGQPLLELYVPDWVAAQEEYLAIRRMEGGAGAALEDAARQRMRLAGMSEAQVRQVASAGKVIARMTVVAPISGVVTELNAREGMTVAAGAPLLRINGLATVWVNAQVPESAAARVAPGSAVEASAAAFPATRFKGKVEAILPQVDPATRTLTARIALANPGAALVPGMFATVRMSPAAREAALVVPSEALIRTGTRSVVMLAVGDGKFAPVEVETGIEADGQVEIVKGLQAGQKVVVSGQFLVDSEASLRASAVRSGDAAAPAASAALHRASGKVEEVGPDEVTISHGPVASLKWGAMTMSFLPPAAGMPPDIAVGDTVAFEFSAEKEGEYRLAAIRKTAGARK